MTFTQNSLSPLDRLNPTDRTNSYKRNRSFLWLDRLKAVGIVGVILNHLVERLFPAAYFSNPVQNWGSIADRVTQVITPLSGYGWADLPLTVVRDAGWLGEQGVQLFLIASGFGLTWSLLPRNSEKPDPSWRSFYKRRLWKLYPLWWFVHGLFLIISLLLRKGMALNQPQFYFSLLGIRFTPETFYYFSPSWWFIGLLIQLYLIFPLLYRGLQRWGPMPLLLGTTTIALTIRGIGLYLIGDPYLELWSRGNIFITRLPEFVLGMVVAAWFYHASEITERWFRSPKSWSIGLVLYGIGMVGAFTLWGMSFSPFLLGTGLLIVLYPLLNQPWMDQIDRLGLRWIGQHSYGLFLVHHPILMRFIPQNTVSIRSLMGVILSVVVMVGLTVFIEWGVQFLGQILGQKRDLN